MFPNALDRRGGSRHRAHAGYGTRRDRSPRLGGSLVPSFQRHGVRLTRVFVQSGVHGIDDVTVVVSKVRRQYSVSTRFDRARRVPAVIVRFVLISRVRSRPQHGQKPHPLDDDEKMCAKTPRARPSRREKANAQTKNVRSDWRRERFRERDQARSHSGPSR